MYLRNHEDYTYLCIDLETDALKATKIWCAVVQDVYTGQVWKFEPHEMEKLAEFITKNKKPTVKWVGHNAISFDFPVISRLLGVDIPINSILDTLNLSYLYHPHMPKGHSLKAWGERFGDDKIEFDDFSAYSEEMMTYCVQDVALTCKVFKALTKRMLGRGFTELSCEIEHKIRKIIDDQQNNGVWFDERAATILLADFESRKAKLEERIHSVFPPELVIQNTYNYRVRQDGTPYASYQRHVERYPSITFNNDRSMYRTWDYRHFNIGSPKQRVERLLRLGWEPTEFTPVTKKGGGGNPKVTEDQLIAFAEKSGIEEVELIKDWMLYETRISSLREWLKHLSEDSRIHGRVYTCGAGTRRMRHTTPNTANICGIHKPYGEEMRSLWGCSPGTLLVGIDAKGLEGRVLIHYLESEEAKAVFMSGDVHQMNADACSAALGFEVSRNTAKTLYYAFLYGASDGKLGKTVGKSRKAGKLIRAAIMANVPGLAELTASIQNEFHATAEGWLATIDGGFVRCPSPHAALNYKCQSAGGILMKAATILAYGMELDGVFMDNPWDLSKVKKVLDVHDEVQMESEPGYAETCGQIYCDAITLAGELLGFNIKQEGDYSVGQNWKETH